MNTTGIERLRTLYSILAGLPSERIDLESWRGLQNNASDDQLLGLGPHCGTNACAVGWACAYPPFKAQGLSYTDEPRFNRTGGFSAVEEFFGVEYSEACELFMSLSDLVGKAVKLGLDLADNGEFVAGLSDRQRAMRRIRRFLMQKGVISRARNEELALQERVEP